MLQGVDRWRQQLIIHCLFILKKCFNTVPIRVRYIFSGHFYTSLIWNFILWRWLGAPTHMTGTNNFYQLPVCHSIVFKQQIIQNEPQQRWIRAIECTLLHHPSHRPHAETMSLILTSFSNPLGQPTITSVFAVCNMYLFIVSLPRPWCVLYSEIMTRSQGKITFLMVLH